MDLHAHRSVGHRGAGIGRAVFIIGLILVVAAILSGCASIVPDAVRGEWSHTSHVFAGPPFGPKYEEDSLDTANVIARWQNGRLYSEIGVGYKLADGGFFGPDLTFTSRIGVELWKKDARR